MVGAGLVAGRSPRRPPGVAHRAGGGAGMDAADDRHRGGPLRTLAGVAAESVWAASAPLAGPALALGAPAGARARALLLSRLPDQGRSLSQLRRHIDGTGARFDGRLRVVAVDRATGRRVVFGRPRSPQATVGAAVAAAGAGPGIFQPARIGRRSYVPGGGGGRANPDTAPARGASAGPWPG